VSEGRGSRIEGVLGACLGSQFVVQYSVVLRHLWGESAEVLWGVSERMVQNRENLRGRLSVFWRGLVQIARHTVGLAE
jgi:hypothetical protein